MESNENLAAYAATGRVLIVDDETLLARAIARQLKRAGLACEIADTLDAARQALTPKHPGGENGHDIVLLDLRLPDGSGMDLLSERAPANGGDDALGPAFVVLTAFGDVDSAVEAMKLGATDYLRKPIDLNELVLVVDKVLRSAELQSRLDYSRQRDARASEGHELLGESSTLSEARERVIAFGRLHGDGQAPPPTVLITGETGTGKDVAARLIHANGPNPDSPFVQVDCASLPRDLMEAELFGHVRGAFTSAHGHRVGLIEAAENGTLFLDEIGELPNELQAKLLNVVERRLVRRIGSSREVSVHARFVAATNRNLAAMVNDNNFRSDLYYRLNVLALEMPPLRICGSDSIILAEYFARQTARRYGRRSGRFTEQAKTALQRYTWPGNVRELKHVIERAALLTDSDMIDESGLALNHPVMVHRDSGKSDGRFGGRTLRDAERSMIVDALRHCGGNVSKAARRLGITRMAMRYRMEKHGLRGGGDAG